MRLCWNRLFATRRPRQLGYGARRHERAILTSYARSRRHHHRSRPQRARLRGLSRHGGLRVRVFERRGVVGGACVTEEFHPGFRNSTAAYTVSLLQPKVIRDLELAPSTVCALSNAARRIFCRCRTGATSLPARDAPSARSPNSALRTLRRYAGLSSRDRPCRGGLARSCAQGAAQSCDRQFRRAPWANSASSPGWASGCGRRTASRSAFSLFRQSAGETLDRWFESDPIKAVLGFDAVVGNLASPYTPGSAYVLLHHTFGEVNGKPGVWGHAIGGMGAITQAMAKAAGRARRRIDVGAAVREVIVEQRPRRRNCARGRNGQSGPAQSLPTSIRNISFRLWSRARPFRGRWRSA